MNDYKLTYNVSKTLKRDLEYPKVSFNLANKIIGVIEVLLVVVGWIEPT
jgi:hypothetical protein